MDFTNKMSDWQNAGTAPSADLQANGFQPGQRPPASVFNWQWHQSSAAITELQEKLASEETARKSADTSTNSTVSTLKTKLDGVASGAEVNQNAFSNVVVGSTTIAADSKTDTLTLAGSNVTLTPDATNDKVTIGITKANVTSALGYTPPTTNTTYSAATTSAAGLMSAADKTKLDGIATGATANTGDITGVTAGAGLGGGGTSGTVTLTNSGVRSITQDSSDGHKLSINTGGTTTTITIPDNNTTYSAATTSAAGLMSASDKSKLDGITSSADSVSFSQSLTSGTQVGTITINGTATKLYAPTPTESSSYAQATSSTLGLVKIGYTESGKNYPVELNSSGQMYVNVPWTDNNTTYSAATTSAAGLMSASDKSKLDGITSSADSVSFSRSLTSGTKIGTITINGTGTDLYCQTNTDTNTTYSAGTGISLSGTTFSNSGVRSISTGSSNGTISVNTNGTSANVAVKGLGSAAYTASTAYAPAYQYSTTDLTAGSSSLTTGTLYFVFE